MAITDALMNKTEVALDVVVANKVKLIAEGVSIVDGKMDAADTFKYDNFGKVTGKYYCQPGFCTFPPQRRRTLLQQSSECVECGPNAYCSGGFQTLGEPNRVACPTPAIGSNVVTFTTGNVTTASSRDQCLAECNARSVLNATANTCTACTTPPNCATPGAACFGSSSQLTCAACAAGYTVDVAANTCTACTTPPNCATPGAACFGSSSQLTCTTCQTGFGLDATANTCTACTAQFPPPGRTVTSIGGTLTPTPTTQTTQGSYVSSGAIQYLVDVIQGFSYTFSTCLA